MLQYNVYILVQKKPLYGGIGGIGGIGGMKVLKKHWKD